MGIEVIGLGAPGEITITPPMEITRGITKQREYCYTHYIIFECDSRIYIAGWQNENWKMINENVIVPSSYVLRLASSRQLFNKMSLGDVEKHAYYAFMNGAR